MIRSPKWLVVVLVFGGILGLGAPALAAETKGKIKSLDVDKNALVFTDQNAKDWTFEIDGKAKIQIGTKDIKLIDLKAGDKATIIYDKVGDKLIAKEIRCELQ